MQMHLFIYFYVSNKDIRVSKILKDDCFKAREQHTLDIVLWLLIIKNRLKYSCTQTNCHIIYFKTHCRKRIKIR